MTSFSLRQAFATTAAVMILGVVVGCDSASSTAPPPPPANLPANAPTAPVDSKKLMEATKGSSSAAFDSTLNPALQKGGAPK